MNYLFRFLQRFHLILIFLLLFIASVWMYVDTSFYQKARFGRLASRITGSVASQFMSLGKYMRLNEANTSLRKENIELKNELERYKNVLFRGGLITRIDSVSGRVYYTYTSARVVKNTTNRRQNFITLNVGRNNGAHEGMGVICAEGVVGIIASVSDNYSSVISVLNTNTKISAKHNKSGVIGSLMWNGENYRKVFLTDVPLHVKLTIGDTVVTSGYSSIFPRNIPIGSIVDFEMDEGNVYNIGVQLFADFKSLDYVYVVDAVDSPERTQLEKLNND